MDVKEHFKNLLRLIRIEREEDRNQYQQKMMYTSMQERKEAGICWYPVIVTRSQLGTGEKIVLHLEKTGDFEQRHVFQVGSSVSLFANNGDKQANSSAVISFVREKKMKIVLNSDDEPEFLNKGKLGLNLLFDESTYEEMERTLRNLMKLEKGRSSELVEILLGNRKPSFAELDALQFPNLNESQNKAVNKILSAQDLAIVHGPPGTGKTTTFIAAIKEVVNREKQVLVCAPSNAAVDLLVEKLVEVGVDVLRLGHPARVTPSVLENSLDARISKHKDFKDLKAVRKKAEELRSIGTKYKRNFGWEERRQRKAILQESKRYKDEARMIEDYITANLMDNAQVIACTFIGSSHNLMRDRFFKTVFIDEAGQGLEPACWAPILKSGRVIMAGDHLQLPPTVKSFEAAKEGLSTTLFERCIEGNESAVMLEDQYRMHHEIMEFSSDYFYNGKLKEGPNIKDRFFPIAEGAKFIDTAGCGYNSQINEKTRSSFNTEEAKFLIDRLLDKVNEIGADEILDKEFRIAVITPYKAQNEILRKLISESEVLSGLEGLLAVDTVDAFQGQERDIIVIGFVRSNPEGEIGFLKDIRRTNVAMTRAKHLLLLIGDSATLGSLEFYNQMVEHFQFRNNYHSAFEFFEY